MVSYSKGNITESPKLHALILNQLALAAILCTYYNLIHQNRLVKKGPRYWCLLPIGRSEWRSKSLLWRPKCGDTLARWRLRF
ncbi:unnamed protein product [Urochloa humidicola]